ncbi:MAG: cytochrome c biogenesis protein ResB [Proteobacteria bacterium]|nr:cytochrome c biogenesis protein ResB [Pseudomonadota bacterium]MBU1710742.1 cytochrome c biogenesis protein ResB [Pseudomonadota bacterium]
MLTFLKRILLRRKTVLSLIVLLLVLIMADVLIPQRYLSGQESLSSWQQENNTLLLMIQFLGLDHVFTSLLFLATMSVFLLALSLSTWDQTNLARKRTIDCGHMPKNRFILPATAFNAVLSEIRKKGYRFQRRTTETIRLSKNPWGYWGNATLHLGMVVVASGSILVALTQQQGRLNLSDLEFFPAGASLPFQENGLLAKEFVLPFGIRLDQVKPDFWENDKTKSLVSQITIINQDQSEIHHELGINKIVTMAGIRIYQKETFGNSFYLVLTDQKGKAEKFRLDISHPQKRTEPAYRDFSFPEIPYTIKAKYLADSAGLSIYDVDPLLSLRLSQNDTIIGEVDLRLRQQGKLGPYQVELLGISRWAGLAFAKLHGISLVFLGFFLIILGAFLVYCTPPREFYLQQQNDSLTIGWAAGRFPELYIHEFDELHNLQGIK